MKPVSILANPIMNQIKTPVTIMKAAILEYLFCTLLPPRAAATH